MESGNVRSDPDLNPIGDGRDNERFLLGGDEPGAAIRNKERVIRCLWDGEVEDLAKS